MTEIRKAGETNSLGDIDVPQKEFRKQVDALVDAVRQLGGNPTIDPGSTVVNDPLSAPYILYVNSYTGSDKFVAGDYASADDGEFDTKMRRISNQRLECGYTEARPFRTINRAVIEAGIITSRDYLNLNPAPCGDLVSIVVAPGAHTCLNGVSSTAVEAWGDNYEPSDDALKAFNPAEGGVILPRGCSLISLDLRKTIVRPEVVPSPANEFADYSNRGTMFRLTGGCYVYGMTFMDKVGFTESHHLLDVFQYASKSQLEDFYAKIRTAFSSSTGVDPNYAVARIGEYEIVGPQPRNSKQEVDTVGSASPYLYNISNRSIYGMNGLFANGAAVDGFKSVVIAQYTGVSLQQDMSCWQIYRSKSWRTVADYDEYINADPNDLRHDPKRRSYHIRAVNNAVIQEVSVFAIGQAIHHAVDSGGEITITNSNSNWGGCSALAAGYHDEANALDSGHIATQVRVPADPLDDAVVRKIQLGVMEDGQEFDTDSLVFTDAGADTLFQEAGYNLSADDYVWVTNPFGKDFYAKIDSYNFSGPGADEIFIKTALINEDGETPEPDADSLVNTTNVLNGQIIYIRRLQDSRSIDDRTYNILIDSPTNARRPVRDYVPVEDGGALPVNEIATVFAAGGPGNEDADSVIQLRYAKKADAEYESNSWYWPGDTVVKDNKHFTAIKRTTGAFTETDWDESFVHMQEDFTPEGYYKNIAPIVIIDGDKDPHEDSEDLGVTSLPPESIAQIEGAIDYIGTQIFLNQLGINESLNPVGRSNRYINVGKKIDFHRPSNIRLYSHAFEWAGFQNYSKAVPKYQLNLSRSNKFTYYFTNEAGGRVYCSGFNEEGAGVTNAGLQDFETGAAISFDAIGNGEIPSNELNTSALPKAQKSTERGEGLGTVGVAARSLVDKVVKDGLPTGASNATNGWKAVEVNDLEVIREYVQAEVNAVVQDLKVLPDEQSVVYVHSAVQRNSANGVADLGSIPSIIKDQWAYYANVHGGSYGEAKDDQGNRLAALLSFRSLGQALEWINGRSPVGRTQMTIHILDSGSTLDYDYKWTHGANKKVVLRGPRQDTYVDPSQYVARLKYTLDTELGASRVLCRDMTLYIGDNNADTLIAVRLRSLMELNNATIKGRSKGDFISFIASDFGSGVDFIYDRTWKTDITFDLKSTGTNVDTRVGHTDIRVYDAVFRTNNREVANASSIPANELVFKLSRAHDQRQVLVEFWNTYMQLRRASSSKTNHKMKWVFDFSGSNANAFALTGPIKSAYMLVTPEQTTSSGDTSGGEFNCEVTNIGSISEVEVFTCANWLGRMTLGNFLDRARDSIGKPGEHSVSGIIADAFAQHLSKSNIAIPVRDNAYHPGAEDYKKSMLAMPNVYNSVWYSSDGVAVPADVSGAAPTDLEEYGGSVEDVDGETRDYDPL